MSISNVMRASPAKSLSLIMFIKKYWYLIGMAFFLIPALITAGKVAYETENPSYPLFVLATNLLTADQVLEHDVIVAEQNIDSLVGMDKPTEGIWFRVVYIWKFFWNVIWKIMGSLWMIFFPFYIIRKITHRGNTSTTYKTMWKATWIFFLYLFITNTIIFIHGIIAGNVLVSMPQNIDSFMGYFILLKEIIPLHGVYRLGKYIIMLAMSLPA